MVRRARPLLGTTIILEIASGGTQNLATGCFEEMQRLEGVFSFHDPGSRLSVFNRSGRMPSEPEFVELLQLTQHVQVLSEDSFFPFRDGQLDLSGIAKGFIVDCALRWLQARAPDAIGVLNAGGDLAFFGGPERPLAHLRLGTPEAPLFRSLQLIKPCLASSSPGFAGSVSSTHYSHQPRHGLGSTAAIQAETAAVADALTKVALFGSPAAIQACCEEFHALALTFDDRGELVESFG